MNYLEYEKAFSSARLSKYLKACDGKYASALMLYRYNIKLCQKLFGVLSVFEVALRNAINEHYITHFSDNDWIRHQLKTGGMLETHPQRASVEKIIEELDKKGNYTNDRIVSSVTLGFWTYMFTKEPFRRGSQTLLKIFPSKINGLGQRLIFNELQIIKAFRNRIAHHEAICFDHEGAVNTLFARSNYAQIMKYIKYLGYHDSKLLYGLNTLPNTILGKIDSISIKSSACEYK